MGANVILVSRREIFKGRDRNEWSFCFVIEALGNANAEKYLIIFLLKVCWESDYFTYIISIISYFIS
jgi:hypothetical protein